MARPRLKETRNKKIGAAATEDEAKAFADACARAGLQPAHTVRQLAIALVEHVRKYGRVEQPIRIEPPTK